MALPRAGIEIRVLGRGGFGPLPATTDHEHQHQDEHQEQATAPHRQACRAVPVGLIEQVVDPGRLLVSPIDVTGLEGGNCPSQLIIEINPELSDPPHHGVGCLDQGLGIEYHVRGRSRCRAARRALRPRRTPRCS
ncbi:MAG: hypothetical protein GY698_15285 [Actinomycetia bacterium]|nr:hypothetical protein [Actinomycetes bacterium]